jgi:hypothetical protein
MQVRKLVSALNIGMLLFLEKIRSCNQKTYRKGPLRRPRSGQDYNVEMCIKKNSVPLVR